MRRPFSTTEPSGKRSHTTTTPFPENQSAAALAQELSQLLASPDPELRDELAYSVLARWIARPNILQPPELRALADEWRANPKSGIGESGTNSVLKRSFSALCLSSIAEREVKTPFLSEQRYHQLLGDALTYLQSERDLRGYDAKLGWIHATAHTADLLQALASRPFAYERRAKQHSICTRGAPFFRTSGLHPR